MTGPQRRPSPPPHQPADPPYSQAYPSDRYADPRQPNQRRGSQVARVVLIVGLTVLAVAGLAIVATFVFVAAAMSSYGSNK
jgi:hypothetical protein